MQRGKTGGDGKTSKKTCHPYPAQMQNQLYLRVLFTCLFTIFWKNSDEVHHKHFSTLCYSGCCNTILFVILGTQSAYTSFHQSVHIWISRVPSQIKWGVKLTWALMSTRNFLFLRNFSIFICILAYCISETNSENLSKFLYFGFILKCGGTSMVS